MPIRRPTSREEQYDHWRRSVAGERVPVAEDEPHCGFYRRRMVRGGPWIPVEIYLHQEIDPDTGELTADEKLMCVRGGESADPYREWPSCRAISIEEYDALVENHANIADMAATHVAVDLGQMAAIRP